MRTIDFKLRQRLRARRTVDGNTMVRANTGSGSPRLHGQRRSHQFLTSALLLMVLLAGLSATHAQGQLALQSVLAFGFSDDGTQPTSLIQGADGCFYGTTSGTDNTALLTNGMVFKLTLGGE